MESLKYLWKKLTPTKALEQSSSPLETAFYESIYRISYFVGLSWSDHDMMYLIYSTLVKIMVAYIVCSGLWYRWYAATEEISLEEIAACINVAAMQLITLYKLKNLIANKEIYKMSMDPPYFETSTDTRRQIVKFWVERHERYLKLLLILGNGALATWFTYPLLDELDYNLMVEISIPYKYNTPIKYAITYIAVGIAFTYTSYFCMVADLIMQSHLIPVICQYSILGDCFRNLLCDCEVGFEGIDREHVINNENFKQLFVRRLGSLVEQHETLLAHSIELRTILSIPMLGQLAASGILICFVGYQASTTIAVDITKWLMSLFYLGYNMFTLYIICRWCEEITIQSQNIGEAIYCSGWEQGVSKIRGVRTSILLVMLRANKPLIFSAGGMYNLSLTSYTSLVKASYSALTFLLRIQRE